MRADAKIFSGDKHKISKAISLIENGEDEAIELLTSISSNVGKANRIGITGPPGVGKSTIVDELTAVLRKRGDEVGIIAVDPTSPFTGGALLGDRIRMAKSAEDEGVFIRSMATRGASGGLARATADVADLLDATGKKYILIETVGVGQSDIDISNLTDCVVVVLSPESGDGIQAMKSGLMEIADILVINKADRPGADKLEYEIRSAYELSTRSRDKIPVLLTQAYNGTGIQELAENLDAIFKDRIASGIYDRHRKENAKVRIKILADFLLQRKLWNGKSANLEKLAENVISHEQSAYSAAQKLIKEFKNAK